MRKSEDINILSLLFKDYYGFEPEKIHPLPGAGSGRRYFRLGSHSVSCIGVVGENLRDCKAFLELDKVFERNDFAVPKVLAESGDGMYYIQEDLGDTSIFDLIKKGGDVESIIREAFKDLVDLQTVPESEWEDKVVYPPFSRRQIFWDLNYFKYEYLKAGGFDFDEEALENDFENLSTDIMEFAGEAWGFMYRDFQSRNIMVKEGIPYFIDFQGGRKGPMLYDAVSFLWQAKAGFSDGFRERMLDVYLDYLCGSDLEKKQKIWDSVPVFVLFRTLQVLGAYGLRGLVEKKAHFIESIPGALENLKSLLNRGILDKYPEMQLVCGKVVDDPRFKSRAKDGKLKVSVFSFSYKKGYPSDFSGNGGGFMFDCRGMHNPGRYEEYKSLTGLDKPVVVFLEEKGEVQVFCNKIVDILAPTVERYIKRGFTSLQVGFGCTGGQHRSVYCAERVGRVIAEKYPEAKIVINHREQRIIKEL